MPHVRVAEKIRGAHRAGPDREGPAEERGQVEVRHRPDGHEEEAFERSEDPEWALKHKVPIDRAYYIEQQLMKPLVGLRSISSTSSRCSSGI